MAPGYGCAGAISQYMDVVHDTLADSRPDWIPTSWECLTQCTVTPVLIRLPLYRLFFYPEYDRERNTCSRNASCAEGRRPDSLVLCLPYSWLGCYHNSGDANVLLPQSLLPAEA